MHPGTISAFIVLGILCMLFNRPLGRFFGRAQGKAWDRVTKHWGFSFSDRTAIGASQFSLFFMGLAMIVMGTVGLLLIFFPSN